MIGFGKADHSFLKMMAFVVVGMIILRGVTNFISSYCLAWVSGKVVMIMRRRLFKHFNVYASELFDRNSTGKLLSRITYDSEMIANSSSSLISDDCSRRSLFNFVACCDALYQLGINTCTFVIGLIIAVLIRMVSKIFVSSVKICKTLWGINLCNGTNAERA